MDGGDRSNQQALSTQVEERACKLIACISHMGNDCFWFFLKSYESTVNKGISNLFSYHLYQEDAW